MIRFLLMLLIFACSIESLRISKKKVRIIQPQQAHRRPVILLRRTEDGLSPENGPLSPGIRLVAAPRDSFSLLRPRAQPDNPKLTGFRLNPVQLADQTRIRPVLRLPVSKLIGEERKKTQLELRQRAASEDLGSSVIARLITAGHLHPSAETRKRIAIEEMLKSDHLRIVEVLGPDNRPTGRQYLIGKNKIRLLPNTGFNVIVIDDNGEHIVKGDSEGDSISESTEERFREREPPQEEVAPEETNQAELTKIEEAAEKDREPPREVHKSTLSLEEEAVEKLTEEPADVQKQPLLPPSLEPAEISISALPTEAEAVEKLTEEPADVERLPILPPSLEPAEISISALPTEADAVEKLTEEPGDVQGLPILPPSLKPARISISEADAAEKLREEPADVLIPSLGLSRVEEAAKEAKISEPEKSMSIKISETAFTDIMKHDSMEKLETDALTGLDSFGLDPLVPVVHPSSGSGAPLLTAKRLGSGPPSESTTPLFPGQIPSQSQTTGPENLFHSFPVKTRASPDNLSRFLYPLLPHHLLQRSFSGLPYSFPYSFPGLHTSRISSDPSTSPSQPDPAIPPSPLSPHSAPVPLPQFPTAGSQSGYPIADALYSFPGVSQIVSSFIETPSSEQTPLRVSPSYLSPLPPHSSRVLGVHPSDGGSVPALFPQDSDPKISLPSQDEEKTETSPRRVPSHIQLLIPLPRPAERGAGFDQSAQHPYYIRYFKAK